LLDYLGFAALVFRLLTAIGLFALRRRRPDAARPVVVPGYPWLPAAYAVLTAALCIDLLIEKPQYSWLGLGIVALGLPVYALWRWLGAARVEAKV
jgi:basic amino acid/polyamine antiporter, APA family